MITLYLVDDDDKYLDSLESYIKLTSEFEISGSFSEVENDEDIEEMMERIEFGKPDVVLMDISFSLKNRPVDFGIELTRRIRSRCPEQKIIILAKDLDDDDELYEVIKRSFRAGATAYLSKSDMEKWPEGIKETINGDLYITPKLHKVLLNGIRVASSLGLTKREVQAIYSLSMDNRIKAVAKDMGLTFDGANFHIRNAKVKLDVQTNQGLVAVALRKGVIS